MLFGVSEFSHLLIDQIPALRRYARVLVRDAQRADDLVQDCLERALDKRRLWRGTGSIRAWLFTIMRNLHANQIRQRARRAVEVAADYGAMGDPAGEPQVDRVLAAEVLDALERLDSDQCEVLLLVAVEGLQYREVAEVLDIPLGTVMSRLARGRECLRRFVAGHDADDGETGRGPQ